MISAKLIQSLEPGDKPYEVRDSRLTGFMIRVQPTGYMSYVVEWARGQRKSIGKVGVLTPAQARDHARNILADAIKGKDPRKKDARSNSFTFNTFVSERYEDWITIERKSGTSTIARLRSCFESEFGDRKLSEINAWVIEKWRSRRLRKGISPATVNRDIGALKAMLQRAVRWGVLNQNPLAELKPKRTDQRPMVRFLDESEERNLRRALDDREAILARLRASNNAWRTAVAKNRCPRSTIISSRLSFLL